MLTNQESQQIKEQLIQQVQNTFPPGQKEQAIQQISSMSNNELEQFLIQNNLIKDSPEQPQNKDAIKASEPQCVFCAINQEQIPSYKIDKNKDSVAVLEINPASKGHSIIIPKKHISATDKLPSSAFSLAKKISKKIKTKLKPKEINISSSNAFGHAIINVLPVYENESLSSERTKASQEELEEIQKLLAKKSSPKPKPKKIKKQPIQLKENIRLPRRIP